MKVKLELFVHGVPIGQDIWGQKVYDRNFIENFYGRKSSVEVQLLIEIIKIDENVNCYYTYLRAGGNILGKENRRGSYFALTVRCNLYYTDIANMYNILDAAYQKLILGTILESDGAVAKFIVQDFNQADEKLKEIRKHIIDYIGSFSIESDFTSLDNFKTNSEFVAIAVNLLECDKKNLLAHIKKHGNLSVSPLHPISQIVEIERRTKKEVDSMKMQLQQQESTLQNQINQIKDAAMKEKGDAIKAIKDGYAEIDTTIKRLEKENSEVTTRLKNEIRIKSDLEVEIEQCKIKLENYESTKHQLDLTKKELEKLTKILSDVKRSLSELNGLADIIDSPVSKIKESGWMYKLNKFLPLITWTAILIIILVVALSTLLKNS